MPNHVTNILTIKEGSIEKVQGVFIRYATFVPSQPSSSYKGEIVYKKEGDNYDYGWLNTKTGEFSYRDDKGNTVVVPEILPGYQLELKKPFEHFPDFNKIIPQPDNIFKGDLGTKEKEMCAKEGRPNWYDWNCENWGTKWNSYGCRREDYNVFVWDTAWSPVFSIVEAMSAEFPYLVFEYKWADEDTGHNCGLVVLQGGEVIDSRNPDSGSKEAYELAFEVNPGAKEFFVLEEDEYVYNEEEY